MQICN